MKPGRITHGRIKNIISCIKENGIKNDWEYNAYANTAKEKHQIEI